MKQFHEPRSREQSQERQGRDQSNAESGQSLIEYIILVALVVLVCVTSTKLLGTKINSKFKDIKEKIDSSIDVRLSP